MMSNFLGFKCFICGEEYQPDSLLYTCPHCGEEGIVDIIYDYAKWKDTYPRNQLSLNKDFSIWRYISFLPVSPSTPRPYLQIGFTPLYSPKRLQEELSLPNLYIKDDGRNPSASFKDRASVIGVVKGIELGFKQMTCASTGNAASSLSCICSAMGIENFIFVPKDAPQAKIAQLLIFGAKVFMIRGSYDQAFDLCIEATDKFGWYNRNTGFNPFLLEGKKTAAYEICEQLAWNMPDKVIVSVGDGCILGGLGKGFYDFYKLGYIDRIPQLIGVQAEGASAVKDAFERGGKLVPVVAQTIADSICVGRPRALLPALRALRISNGFMVSVSDEEILAAMRILPQYGGVFGEPAGVASLAGLIKLLNKGKIKAEEKVVVLITGNGLKDIKAAISAVKNKPFIIDPDIASVKTLLKEELE